MRIVISFLCILIISVSLFAQKKRLMVSPNQEIIPIEKETTIKLIEQYNAERGRAVREGCSAQQIFGFDPGRYPENGGYLFHHNEVCGEWFVVPADGSIDTVYFHTVDSVGSSGEGTSGHTVLFRIFTSYITPTQGPGIRPGPYRPPCTSWGYWVSTNDQDQGVAAFREDATDTTWVATNLLFGDWAPSFPPFGNSLWGLQGFPIDNLKPRTIVKVAMNDLTPLLVHKDDVIFISFKVPAAHHIIASLDTAVWIHANDMSAPYPSRDWKFYEHDSGPSTCAGIPRTEIKRGWVPRGPSDPSDTLNTTAYNIWYSMTPSTNTPPQISQVSQVHTTTDPSAKIFTCTIFDCDAENAGKAGVRNAFVRYSYDMGKTWITGDLQYDGNDQFECTLPAVHPPQTVYYKVVADDSVGLADSSGTYSYRIIALDDFGWYRVDTVSSPTSAELGASNHVIDTSQYFILARDYRAWEVHTGDDGTAGPFPISDGFIYYGDTMNYGWVGVNGAIALSKTSTDTIEVNATGRLSTSWDFPNRQRHGTWDTAHYDNMPKAFISPYSADWIVKADSPLGVYGKIRYQDDADKFVVEWDSVGNYDNATGLPFVDFDIFRVVLNKTNNSIEFQYDNIGLGGLDTTNLTGIQCDSNYHPMPSGMFPPSAFYNRFATPPETRLHNGLCIHYIPVLMTMETVDGWNLLSVPSTYLIATKNYLYPNAVSAAFIFSGGYVPTATLTNGPGFWLKFSGAQSQQAVGRALTSLDIPVIASWNMIGSISSPVPVANITADAGTGIGPGSTFFGYNGGYFATSAIEPGYGYWVRAAGAGNIHLTGSSAPKTLNPVSELNTLHRIMISQTGTRGGQTLYIGSGAIDAARYEMPPPAPEGTLDARFASDRMVEIYPAILEQGKKYEYPIEIRASRYPLVVRWQQVRNPIEKATLTLRTEDGEELAVLNGSGKITINDAGLKKIIVAVSPGIAIPKVFALSRNYPNPFNPVTRFSVDVPWFAQVDVSVYDILGRKIATIWNAEQTAGYHTMEWDGRTSEGQMAPSGVYFIRMTAPAGQFTAVQKALLMK